MKKLARSPKAVERATTHRSRYRKDLDINPEDLDVEFARQPGKYARWASLLNDARDKRERLEVALGSVEAESRSHHRRSKRRLKLTEMDINDRVKLDPDVLELRRRILDAKHVEGVLKVAVRSFEDRRDMMVSIGAHQRNELVAYNRIRKKGSRKSREDLNKEYRERVRRK